MGDQSTQAPQHDNQEPAGAQQSSSQEKTPAPAYYPTRGPSLSSPSSPDDIPLTRHDLLFIQRIIGNRAVGRLLQRKAKIGQPGDEYEREADRVADQVMYLQRKYHVWWIEYWCPVDEEYLQISTPETDKLAEQIANNYRE